MNIDMLIQQLELDCAGIKEQIISYDHRLRKIAQTIDRDGLIVGSKGQRRGNPELALQLTIERERNRASARLREVEDRLAAAQEARAQDTLLARAVELTARRSS
jgi:hypothetical protein